MNTKKTVLTKAQEQYIDKNWGKLTFEQVADNLLVPVTAVNYYCAQKGYRKTKKAVERIEEKVKQDIDVKRIKRPPAVYSNRSHEQILSYYENLIV